MECLTALLFLAVPVYILAFAGLFGLPRIGSSATCMSCGYSREGMEQSVRCPECGHEHGPTIDRSFNEYVPRACDRWLLVLLPVLIGLAACAAYVALSYVYSGRLRLAAAPFVGLVPVAPSLVLAPFLSGRVPRHSALKLVTFGPVLAVALNTYLALEGAWINPVTHSVQVAIPTALFTGIAAIVVASGAHARIKELRRMWRASPSTPEPNRT
jgi:hypothetical protein